MQGTCHCLFVLHVDPKDIFQKKRVKDFQIVTYCNMKSYCGFQYNYTFSIGFPSQTPYISDLQEKNTRPKIHHHRALSNTLPRLGRKRAPPQPKGRVSEVNQKAIPPMVN